MATSSTASEMTRFAIALLTSQLLPGRRSARGPGRRRPTGCAVARGVAAVAAVRAERHRRPQGHRGQAAGLARQAPCRPARRCRAGWPVRGPATGHGGPCHFRVPGRPRRFRSYRGRSRCLGIRCSGTRCPGRSRWDRGRSADHRRWGRRPPAGRPGRDRWGTGRSGDPRRRNPRRDRRPPDGHPDTGRWATGRSDDSRRRNPRRDRRPPAGHPDTGRWATGRSDDSRRRNPRQDRHRPAGRRPDRSRSGKGRWADSRRCRRQNHRRGARPWDTGRSDDCRPDSCRPGGRRCHLGHRRGWQAVVARPLPRALSRARNGRTGRSGPGRRRRAGWAGRSAPAPRGRPAARRRPRRPGRPAGCPGRQRRGAPRDSRPGRLRAQGPAGRGGTRCRVRAGRPDLRWVAARCRIPARYPGPGQQPAARSPAAACQAPARDRARTGLAQRDGCAARWCHRRAHGRRWSRWSGPPPRGGPGLRGQAAPAPVSPGDRGHQDGKLRRGKSRCRDTTGRPAAPRQRT